MKKMLTVSNGDHFAVSFIKAALALVTVLALGAAFWIGSTPAAQAQNMSPAKMIEAQMPHGKTMQNADKAELLSAVCAAVKKFRSAAPQIVRAAVSAHPEWKNDILRSAFNCLGNDDCGILSRVLRGAIAGSPGDASGLTQLATELAPACAGSFGGATGAGHGGGDGGEGNFGNAPGNLNPPPGSIGGGGAQGSVLVVCFRGQTLFVTPERAQELVNQGATVGACQVTTTTNQ